MRITEGQSPAALKTSADCVPLIGAYDRRNMQSCLHL
jgi:hypothetical protein